MKPELINNLIELRKRIIYIVLGVIVVFAGLFSYANDIYGILSKPLLSASALSGKLIATDVTSVFFIPIKLTILCAVFISLPNTIYQIWVFVSPAMYKHERRMLFTTIIIALVLFCAGVLFCYFFVLPIFFKFIGNFKDSSINVMTDITNYYNFVINLFIVFGITFLTPIFIVLLIYFDIVSYGKIKKVRAFVFVGCFIVAAILTPPDVLSQTLLAISLYILYEVGLLFARLIKPARK